MADFHVFCDESYTEDTYRVQGGIWADHAGMRVIRAELARVRNAHPRTQEFKWNSVRGKRRRHAYHDFAQVFFNGPAAAFLSFKCLVVHRNNDPSSVLDSEGRNLGFYKAYHTLLKYRLEPGNRYRIRLDRRTGPRVDPEAEVADHLNKSCCGWEPPAEVLSCVGVESHTEDLVQMADLLCGAVGWAWNGRRSGPPAKVILAQDIAASLKWKELTRETAGSATKFNVWRYRPKRK